MNDNIIINTISRTYFTIVSFFIFLFITLTTSFIILHNGIYIESLKLPNIKIEQLYIKWDEKIDISLKKIYLQKNNSKKEFQFHPQVLKKYIKYIHSFNTLFHKITLEEMHYNNMLINLNYKDNKEGILSIKSQKYELKSRFKFLDNYFLLYLDSLVSKDNKIHANGNIYFDITNLKIYTNTSLILNNDINITMLSKSDTNKFSYKILNNQDIKNINYVVNYLNVPKEVRYWLLDAIDMKNLHINSAYGFVDFKKPNDFLNNLYVDATIHELNYMYNPQLDAIHTLQTNLIFKNSTLYIYPKKAYTYNIYLDKSWLKIDFSNNKDLLTLQLLFNASLNKDVLNILQTYKIKIPVIQKTGKVATNLEIKIALKTIDVDAKGTFESKEGRFNYLGLDIDSEDVVLKLNNTKISINNMSVDYKHRINGRASLRYNAHTNKGLVSIDADTIKLPNKILLHNKPLKITYKINRGSDTIHVDKSTWQSEIGLITLDALNMSFDFNTTLLTVPTTYFQLSDISDGYIDGYANLEKNFAKIHTDMLSFKYRDILLNQSNTQFNIQYNKDIQIVAKNDISLLINDKDVNLSKMKLTIDDKALQLHNTKINIGNLFNSNIYFTHLFNAKEDKLYFNNLKFALGDAKLYANDSIRFDITHHKNEVDFSSPQYAIYASLNDSNWSLNFNSLKKISKNSNFLSKYKLDNGKIKFFQDNNDDKIHFSSQIKYPYNLLIQNDKNISDYRINGKIENKKISLNINKKIKIKFSKDIKISIKDIGLNTQELLKMSEDINMTSNKKETINISLVSKNLFFHVGKDRDVISDTFSLQSIGPTISAQLKYKNGNAGFKMTDNIFNLHGSGFNDTFMQRLFALAKFKGGSLDFYMKGQLKDYIGVGYIKDTTLLDYKVLNNVLAFVNTVPSLVTFSLPGYDTNGLYVDTSYAKFHAKDGLFNVSDFSIDSKEINIVGLGKANLRKDTINATLNLKSDLASDVSKIPIVGYILFDGESISTSMKITGKLSDPKVESQLAKDIIVAPLNIIKRTFLFPFKVIKDSVSK